MSVSINTGGKDVQENQNDDSISCGPGTSLVGNRCVADTTAPNRDVAETHLETTGPTETDSDTTADTNSNDTHNDSAPTCEDGSKPREKWCDGRDNDSDGKIDEGDVCSETEREGQDNEQGSEQAGKQSLRLVQLLPRHLRLGWDEFYYHILGHFLAIDTRPRALTWIAYFINEYNYTLPGFAMTAIYSGTFLILGVWLTRSKQFRLDWLATALVIQCMTTFLFGKQAFCNFYYLVAFLTLLGSISWMSPASDSPKAANDETHLPT